jgi:hypothetical protein
VFLLEPPCSVFHLQSEVAADWPLPIITTQYRRSPGYQLTDLLSVIPSSLNIRPHFQEKASSMLFFAPTLEKGAQKGEEVFLTGKPLELMQEGKFVKVPFISGITSHEGMLFMRGKNSRKL